MLEMECPFCHLTYVIESFGDVLFCTHCDRVVHEFVGMYADSVKLDRTEREAERMTMGYVRSEETRKRMSEAQRARYRKEGQLRTARLAEGREAAQKTVDEATRERISQGMKASWARRNAAKAAAAPEGKPLIQVFEEAGLLEDKPGEPPAHIPYFEPKFEGPGKLLYGGMLLPMDPDPLTARRGPICPGPAALEALAEPVMEPAVAQEPSRAEPVPHEDGPHAIVDRMMARQPKLTDVLVEEAGLRRRLKALLEKKAALVAEHEEDRAALMHFILPASPLMLEAQV